MKIFKNKFADFEFKTVYITDAEEADAACKKLLENGQLYGLDIETAKQKKFLEHPQAGLCPHLSTIRLLQIYSPKENIAYVFDMFPLAWSDMAPVLEKCHFVAHNAVFEIQHLSNIGFKNLNIGCSMLLSQIIDGAEHSPRDPIINDVPSELLGDDIDDDKTGLAAYKKKGHSLDALTQRLFGYKVQKTQQVSDWGKPKLDTDQITYAGLDAILTYKCAKVLAPKITEYKMAKAYKLLKDMQHVVASMQLTGLPVDWEYHEKLIDSWERESDKAFEKCKPFFTDKKTQAMINLRSGKQMSAWLIDHLKDDPLTLAAWPRTEKGAYAFGKTVIGGFTKLDAIKHLLEYKKYAKLIDTYGESLVEKKHPITQNLHTSYTLGETRTGRLSSRNPNCQNYPRDKGFRDMFMAKKGHVLVVSDFSQIELRLQAEFSKDPAMLKVYKTGGDIYESLAGSYFNVDLSKLTKEKRKELRFFGKVVMLALGYGMGPNKLGMYAANGYNLIKPQNEWEKAHKHYHQMFKTYSKWCDKVRERATALGYIETLLGKRRKLHPDEVYTRAPNTVIQGSAAELMMRAMLICSDRVKGLGQLVATVHDEILIHTPNKNAEKVKEVLAGSMNDAMLEIFPDAVTHHVADAAYGVRWGEVKAEL